MYTDDIYIKTLQWLKHFRNIGRLSNGYKHHHKTAYNIILKRLQNNKSIDDNLKLITEVEI